MPKCAGQKNDGSGQCGMNATHGDYCRHHVPKDKPKSEKFTPETDKKVNELPTETQKTQVTEGKPSDDKYAIAARRRAMNKARLSETGALQGQNLYAPQRPGFKRRWVHGSENRLARLQDQGYTFVEENTENVSSDDLGNRKSKLVDTEKDGGREHGEKSREQGKAVLVGSIHQQRTTPAEDSHGQWLAHGSFPFLDGSIRRRRI